MTPAVPKAELHCHIEGAASTELVRAQARRYGADVSAILDGEHFAWSDFTSFLRAYDAAAALFRTPEDYALLAESYLESLVAGGAIYSEIFVSPDHALGAGLAPREYVAGLAEGIERARSRSGIECRMIVIGVRHFGAEAVTAAARFAAERPHRLVTGFGMAGEERYGRASDYAKAFEIAREAGLGTTIHAGELAGAESVREAIDHIGPARIGHGVRAIEDADLVRRIVGEGIVLEVCPGSNVALGIYADFASHPLPRLLAAGVRATLNSDDPPYFSTSLAREYDEAEHAMGLGRNQLLALTRTAIEAAFVDETTRAGLLRQLSAGS